MRLIALALIAAAVLACPDDPYCLSCSKKGRDFGDSATPTDAVCLYCQYSFFNPESGLCDRKITSAVEECEAYKLKDGQQVCARCQMGFFLNEAENKCVKCAVQNCIECNAEQICTACIGGLIPEKDDTRKEKHKCGESKKPAPNCRVTHGMDLEGKCYKCEQGFALNNEQDKACIKSVQNCQVAHPTEPAAKCLQCSSSHFIKADGSCEKHNSLSILWVLAIIVPVSLALIAYGVMRLFRKRATIGDSDADTYHHV